MMEMKDYTRYPNSLRAYGGAAGRKVGILIEDEPYILKLPGNLKERNMKNVRLSYSNGPVSEYIGSHIYHSIGLPVHETSLGTYNGKVAVACKDFLKNDEKLYEFEKLKVTFVPQFLDSNGNETNGTGCDLQEVLLTINEHKILNKIEGVEKRFWDMFVIDALIGNPDRNNGNWGVIIDSKNNIRLAPVYDNGNCLNDKWDDEKMQHCLMEPKSLVAEAYKGKICIYELNDRRINPYKLIEAREYPGCNAALKRIVPNIDMSKIAKIIDEVPCISAIQKQFYMALLNQRYENVLLPAYQLETENSSIKEGMDKWKQAIYDRQKSMKDVPFKNELSKGDKEPTL